MEMDTCILEVGREFVISKYDKLPSSAWRRVCSGSPGAAASRGAAGQTVNVLPADGETSEGDRWTSLFPRGSVSPSCLASVSAALADTEAMLHAISPSADACFLCPRNQLIAATEALISAGCGVCLAGTDFFKITGKPVRAPALQTGAWWRGSGLGSLRLQVSSFFVELGPAAPRSPASCRAAMSLKASRGGVLVGGGPGGLARRVVVDLQPPRSLRGEPVGEANSTEGWEKLPDDGLRVALELESEAALEQWGVWLFAGQRFARITGPAVGCSASSIAATCCSSLATLRRLCPKVNFHSEPPFQATVGEVLQRGCLQQMLDTGVVPYFDRDDATVGGSMHVEDGVIVHKLPSGSMQRWKIHEMTANPFGEDDLSNQVRQPAEEVLSIGSTVQYWSTTVQRWVSATVLALNEDGTYRLDIKKRASRQFIKEAAGAEESQEMPATSEPAVSGSAREQGHASHASVKHEKVAAGTPGKRRRARSSVDPKKAKAKAKIRKKASKQSSSDSDSDGGSEGSSSSS